MRMNKVTVRVAKVAVAIILIVYAYMFFWSWAFYMHKASATAFELGMTYKSVCKYRDKNGRWPDRLDQAPLGGDFVPPTCDPIFHKPWLYSSNAKPGTNAILLAWPEPLEVGVWPIIIRHREVIRANGDREDIGGAEAR